MKIVVIGATGPTGRLVVDQALARGHDVIAYVRQPAALQPRERLKILGGQLGEAVSLQAAITGSDAVLCCLGTHQMRNVSLMQQSLPLIIDAIHTTQVRRFVLLSAYGVGDTARTAGIVARIAYRTMVKSVYGDKQKSEALLAGSRLAWTIVCPVILTDGPISDAVEVRSMDRVQRVKGLPKVSRANVAQAMLDAAHSNHTIGQRLLVTPCGTVE